MFVQAKGSWLYQNSLLWQSLMSSINFQPIQLFINHTVDLLAKGRAVSFYKLLIVVCCWPRPQAQLDGGWGRDEAKKLGGAWERGCCVG